MKIKILIARIRRREKTRKLIPRRRQRSSRAAIFAAVILSIFTIFLAGKVAFGVFQFIRDFRWQNIFSVLAVELPKDKNGFTNILLFGDGGGAHEGGDLTDTIIVASVDTLNKNAVLLSIPRDFYIDNSIGGRKVNQLFRDGKIHFLNRGFSDAEAKNLSFQLFAREFGKIFNLQIHRFAKIDFSGFEKIVDAVGGISVNVERDIFDPRYPDGNWGWETFRLDRGRQTLNGATALKFARSRHDSSDFDRAKRQQKVLQALREKSLQKNILTNSRKIREILEIVADNFSTNVSWREMLTFAHLATLFERDQIFSKVLTDDPTLTGGFLTTPDRELFGGNFVLVPFLQEDPQNRFAQIRTFSDFIFQKRELFLLDPPRVRIFNGTGTDGLAGLVSINLERYAIPITQIATANEISDFTKIKFAPTEKNKKIVDSILQIIDGVLVETEISDLETFAVENLENATPSKIDEIEITLGKDFGGIFRIPRKSQILKSSE